ncbi:hypothetical protein CesoFtcFv8_002879 [Champsocephalus esox]|uniref:Uncharacterized protein n=1 Tax=Champsocephalus esox TaxID=159716 RepID=A0AAN8HI13_9TELE|nr:hypothetical protein CesoFtcFv8_002879 [Champsocephalus esox]
MCESILISFIPSQSRAQGRSFRGGCRVRAPRAQDPMVAPGPGLICAASARASSLCVLTSAYCIIGVCTHASSLGESLVTAEVLEAP